MMTSLQATVAAVLIADTPGSFLTRRVDQVALDWGGIPGDYHHGLTRKSGGREPMYPRGTQIRNRRQISIVAIEECAQIAQAMGLETLLPEWIGANVLLQGVPNLTQLPAGSRLLLPNGTGLVCEGENHPCPAPGKVLQSLHPEIVGLAKRFVPAAKKRRGIVCTVERVGTIAVNEPVKILVEPSAPFVPLTPTT